jgi:hypothetical protein
MTEDSAILIDLHSAEVVHFTHTIRILIMWASSLHNKLCHDKHPIRAFHSSTLVWPSTLWSLPPRPAPTVPPYLEHTPTPRRENPRDFWWLRICRCTMLTHIWHQPGFRGVAYHFLGTANPNIVMRLPALRQINFELSPVPYQGNVAAQDKLVWQTFIHNAPFHKSTSSFFSIFQNIFS